MSIFEFDDYRGWLNSVISEKMTRNTKFSIHGFARKVKMSQSLLSLILSDKRKLTTQKASPIMEYLKLGAFEQKYLSLLIEKEKVPKTQKKRLNSLQRDLDELKKRVFTVKHSHETGRPFSAWHYDLLYAAIDLHGPEKTAPSLAKFLGLKVEDVTQALKLLLELGLVQRVGDQYLPVKDPKKRLPVEVIKQTTWKICKTILEKAQVYFEDSHLNIDTIHGRILAINPNQLKVANERITKFVDELEAILQEGEKTMLVQYSFQLFDVE